MPLILSTAPPTLQQLTKTEVVLDRIKGVSDKHGNLHSYFGDERMRLFTPESAYDAYLHNKLVELLEKLAKETPLSSSAADVISNAHFKKIVSYGEVMAPAILDSLRRSPSVLVWALNQIFNMRISKSPVSIERASAEWVKWGKAHRLVA